MIDVIWIIDRNQSIIGWPKIVLGRTKTSIRVDTIPIARISLTRCRAQHRIGQAIASSFCLTFYCIDLDRWIR